MPQISRSLICVLMLTSLGTPLAFAGEHPAWTVRDAAVIIETLDIEDRESQAIVELLLDDYDESWQQLLRDQQVAIDALTANKSAGDGYLRQCFETSASFGQSRDVLAQEFEAGIQAFLEEEDQQTWSKLKRAIRRRNLLPKGQLKGERTDLYQVLQDIHSENGILEHAGIQDVLRDWEEGIDPLLVRRAALDRTYPSTFRTLCMQLRFNEALQLATQRLLLQQAIRDHTDASSQAIKAQLHPGIAQTFADHLNTVEKLAGFSRITRALLQALQTLEPPTPEAAIDRDQLIADWQMSRRTLMHTLRVATRSADGGRTVADLKKRLGKQSDWPRREEALFHARLAVMKLDEQFDQQACRFLGRSLCGDALAGQPNAIKRLIPPRTQRAPFHEPTPEDATGPDPMEHDEPISTENPFPEPEPGHHPGEPIPNIEPDPNAPDPFPPPDPSEPVPDPFPG